MAWKKIGFFQVPSNSQWMETHCQLPVGLSLNDTNMRVFFAARSKEQHSSIGYVDIELLKNGFEVCTIAETPVLSPGPIGFFDQHGVYPSSLVFHNNIYYLYFIGWNKGEEPPLFYANIGLALSSDGKNFERYSTAPILQRSSHDPCLVTSPDVYQDNGIWRMTYVSGIAWLRNLQTGRLESRYHIKYAESKDGINWDRLGKVAIDLLPGETNVARSSVIKQAHHEYKMWFSYIHENVGKYRIGYAESKNGYDWIRNDNLSGIQPDQAYDSNMICYPNVIRHNNSLYMLFNGNDYGKQGFGIAIWED